ncbi:hypothetical protein [Nonomuraea dietziae]|uniref:hypothetical protein n=1 Tax=Nonomuraea dietziae TaxID=65515 RepID=UPI003423A519
MEIGTILPDAYKAMAGLEKVIGKSGLPKPLPELVRLRASQINGVVTHMTPESFK